MPHDGYADPVTNDGPRFHADMPVSELTERDTRAIEASDVSSTPPILETTDGVTITKMSQPSTGPLLCAGAQAAEPQLRNPTDRGSKAGPQRARGHLTSNRARGENADEPQRPLPDPLRSGQGHLNLLVRS